MKLFTNKGLLQKIAIVLIVIILFSFTVPQVSQASIGGKLFKPVVFLFGGLGDAIIGGLQHFMMGTSNVFSVLIDQDSVYGDELKRQVEKKPSPTKITIDKQTLDTGWGDSTKGIQVPNFLYSPEMIFSNNVPALDVNFLEPKEYAPIEEDTTAPESSSMVLHDIIASWYVAFRNIAIVGLLSVLVYIGIRVIISSSADDKAKFKQRLMDWLVAVCLLFFIHYIMAFTLTIVEEVTKMFGEVQTIDVIVTGSNTKDKKNEEMKFKTTLMGYIRFMVQSEDIMQIAIYLILYLVLVIYTLMFTFTYLKRVLYMAFLTMIAPLVALTYPLDKISDGKAQAFDMWIKEYVFNALIQPIHLCLYTMLIGSSMQLVVTNPVYALVAMGFLLPAEKFIRKMFGFEKASTPGSLGAVAGGALAWKAIGQLGKLAKGKGSGKGGSGSDGDSGGLSNPKIDKTSDPYANYLNEGDNNNQENVGRTRTADDNTDSAGENGQSGLLDQYGNPIREERPVPQFEDVNGNVLNTSSNTQELGASIEGNNTNNEQQDQRGRLARIGGALASGTSAWAIDKRRALQRRFTGPKIANFAGRTARRAALGAAGAALGIGAGTVATVASGGENGLQYIGGGAVLGSTLANKGGDKLAESTKSGAEVFMSGAKESLYTEEQRAEKAQEKFNKDFKLSESNIKVLEDEFGKKATREMLSGKSDEYVSIDSYLNAGIDDINLIKKAQKVHQSNGRGKDDRKTLLEAQMAKSLDKDTFRNKGKVEPFRGELAKSGITGDNAKVVEKNVRKMIE